MESQSLSEITGTGDCTKEGKDENGNRPENKDVKKSTKEKDLREKIKQYLENSNDSTQSEARKYEKAINSDKVDVEEIINQQALSVKPCNYFNDFGTCKYKSGHVSKSGDTNLLHICRFCHGSYGKRNPHPESLCSQLRSNVDLLDHGKPLQLDNLNTEVLTKGTNEELGQEISGKLQEPKVEMVVGLVGVVGRDAAVDMFKKTQKVESDGGMMIKNGARRRTAGGTFLQLLRENPHIDQESVASFFNKFNGVQIAGMPNIEAKRKENMNSCQVEPMVQPCDYFNDVGACKLKAGHLSKSGLTSRLHICRVCFARNGEKNFHAETDCHLNPNTSLKTLNTSMISSFNYTGAKPKFQDQGSTRFHQVSGTNAHPDMHRENQETCLYSQNRRMDVNPDKSTPRSRLVQARGIFGKGDQSIPIGKSTPKSRLTESMDNYMSNVGSNRNANTNDKMLSCTGRSRQNIVESQLRGYGSIKDQKLDSMKDSINQIIGCLNQQRSEFPKINDHEENRVITKTGDEVANMGHLNDKLKAKLKMEGMEENRNKQEIAGKKAVKGGNLPTKGIKESVIKTKQGMKQFSLNPSASPFSPTVVPFNPLTPPPFLGFPAQATHQITFPGGQSQNSHMKVAVANVKGSSKRLNSGKSSSVGLEQNEKKTGNFPTDHDEIHSFNQKKLSSIQEAEKNPNFFMEMEKGKCDTETGGLNQAKGKSHCLCPPYCPDCLERIKTD